MASGHTIGWPFLTRRSAAKPVGPRLLLEEPVGSLLKKEEVERGSTPRSPEQAVYDGSRDDPALAPSQSKAKDHVRLRHVGGSFAGAAVPGGRGQRNEHAATRRSARGLGGEPAGREANVFCFTA